MADDAGRLNEVLAETSFLYGGNAGFVEDLHAKWAADPSSVEPSWRAFFEQLRDQARDVIAANAPPPWTPPPIAEPRPEWREAMAWRWWLRHGRVGPSDPLTELLRGVARGRERDAEERASYEPVAAVLGDTVRASSAVECMNSVLRMQQSRHRQMTQPMLDLKRLYWNCRAFRSGPREGACPYRALGLELPTYDFWELLRADPAQLTQQLSTPGDAE